MNKNTMLIAILIVLIVVSAVQAIQLTGLKTKLSNNDVSTKTKSSIPAVKSAGSSGDVAVPKSLDNLPQMVGGC